MNASETFIVKKVINSKWAIGKVLAKLLTLLVLTLVNLMLGLWNTKSSL